MEMKGKEQGLGFFFFSVDSKMNRLVNGTGHAFRYSGVSRWKDALVC